MLAPKVTLVPSFMVLVEQVMGPDAVIISDHNLPEPPVPPVLDVI
jgi:hypothetical protein